MDNITSDDPLNRFGMLPYGTIMNSFLSGKILKKSL